MSKIAFVGDVHVGNHKPLAAPWRYGLNSRCEAVLATLEKAVRVAEEQGCWDFVVLGDLFDTASPPPQMVWRAGNILRSTGMNVFLLCGNHDQRSGDKWDNALAPLWGENIQIIQHQEGGGSSSVWLGDAELILVPFQPGKASLWCPAEVGGFERKRPEEPGILCLHLGLKDGSEPKFLEKADDAVNAKALAEVCREQGITDVIAGNWHFRKRWDEGGVHMFQCGTLCPTGWDNPGIDGHGTLAVYDGKKKSWGIAEIVGPRFLKWVDTVSQKQWDEAVGALKGGHQLYIRWYAEKELLEVARAKLSQLGAHGDLRYEVIPDGTSARVGAARAARAAKDSNSLEEALESFVSKMDVDEGLDRDAVRERCRKYLT